MLCVDAAAAAAKNHLSYSLECTGVTSKCKRGNVFPHTRVLSYTSTGVEDTLLWRMYCVGRVPWRSLCQFLQPWPSEQSIAVTQRPAWNYKCLQPCMCGSCARDSVSRPTINPTWILEQHSRLYCAWWSFPVISCGLVTVLPICKLWFGAFTAVLRVQLRMKWFTMMKQTKAVAVWRLILHNYLLYCHSWQSWQCFVTIWSTAGLQMGCCIFSFSQQRAFFPHFWVLMLVIYWTKM